MTTMIITMTQCSLYKQGLSQDGSAQNELYSLKKSHISNLHKLHMSHLSVMALSNKKITPAIFVDILQAAWLCNSKWAVVFLF